jgi:hypothetical protein
MRHFGFPGLSRGDGLQQPDNPLSGERKEKVN